MIMIWDATLLQ